MSVTPNVIHVYGSANMPEADGSTVGGAVDFTKGVAFYDIPAVGTVDVVSSSSSDTATKIQVSGRDSTGIIQTPSSVTLTGTTLISATFGGQQFERLLAGVISGGAIAGLSSPGGTAAVGDVACIATTRSISGHTCQAGSANTSGVTPPIMKLQSGDGATVGALVNAGLGAIIRITGGTGANQLRRISAQYSSAAYGTDIIAINRDWGTVPDATSTYDIGYGILFDILPNAVTAVARVFATAAANAAGGSQILFYEKVFVVNTNTSTALSPAQIEVLSETPSLPSGVLLDMAMCKAANDTATATNRQTLPANGDSSALTFVTQPSLVSVIANSGSLAASSGAGSATNAQGIWYRLTVPAGSASYKGAALTRVVGSTT